MSSGVKRYFYPEVTPDPAEQPSFDPLLGFPNGRPERVSKVTDAELKSALIPLEHRDFCADLAIDYKRCRRDTFPFVVKCSHEKHAYLNCKYEDFVIRAKEYERERRLKVKAEEAKRRSG